MRGLRRQFGHARRSTAHLEEDRLDVSIVSVLARHNNDLQINDLQEGGLVIAAPVRARRDVDPAAARAPQSPVFFLYLTGERRASGALDNPARIGATLASPLRRFSTASDGRGSIPAMTKEAGSIS